jgi:hypothetical protein
MAVKKKTTRKVLSKEQRMVREKAIIHDLSGGGMSYRQIAAKHHVSLPTVNAKARKAGITRKGVRRPYVTRARAAAVRATTRKTHTKTTRRTYIRGGNTTRFNDNFRKLIMTYYPTMPLSKFERLTRIVSQAVSI